ncbi:MAG: SIMPL domain-containing protein [Eubacteriales bacterium]|nr:SIMPL domain-containing protein [Eubacteriales bacterium]
MNKTITVKGIGRATAKPDQVVLSMVLEAQHQAYDRAMALAAQRIQQLEQTLAAIGFAKDAVKTTDLQVRTQYDRVQAHDGLYQNVFRGYRVTQALKLAFDFDAERLSQALAAIGGCLSHPQLSVAFTVKDSTAIDEALLRSAAVNAKRKAEILCQAAGVTLGELRTIDYDWGELDIYSRTRFDCAEDVLPLAASRSIDITPEDIDAHDTVTFVWAIG